MVLYFVVKCGIMVGAMKLYYDKRAKDPIYYAQQGFRVGKKTTTKNVFRIGKHSELLAITDDPLAYAKAEIDKRNEELKNNSNVTMEVKIDFDEKIKAKADAASSSNCLNIGYFVLQQIYHDLKLPAFIEKITSDSRITFDANDVWRFLTYSRILSPGSKLHAFEHLSSYYEKPELEYHHIFDTMDILQEHYDEYISHLFDNSSNIVKRDNSICYFDCSNYYFETECEDEDYTDPVTGETMKGLRKYGASKEHRPNPIVQMGLFMDANGIPLSMCINSGSDNEQKCAVPEATKLVRMFKGKKFIYCADAGLGSLQIRQFNSMGGRAFIVTQSIKKLSDVLQQAVFNDFDYRLLSSDKPVTTEMLKNFDRKKPDNLCLYNDFAYKVIPADKAFDMGLYEEKEYKNGKTRKVKSKAVVPQKIIITFSRKMMEYQRYIRNRQVERAANIMKSMNPSTFKKGPNDVTRFIKRTSATAEGEKAIDKYEIDADRIAEEEKYDGFYAIATNLEDEAKDIIAISSNRYKIEDCFRIMKTNFSARPVFHHKGERIKAHFLLCYTALLIFRLLEAKLKEHKYSCTTLNILETLQNMQVVNIEDMFYTSTFNGSNTLTAFEEIWGLRLDRKYYRPKELNVRLKKILK